MTTDEFLAQLVQTMLPYILTILAAAMSWASVMVVQFIRTKVKNEQAAAILGRLNTETCTAAQEVWQTYVAAIKEASEDGKLTPEERRQALDEAVKKAKSYLGPKGLETLEKVIGPEDLTAYIVSRIESAIAKGKARGELAELVDA